MPGKYQVQQSKKIFFKHTTSRGIKTKSSAIDSELTLYFAKAAHYSFFLKLSHLGGYLMASLRQSVLGYL